MLSKGTGHNTPRGSTLTVLTGIAWLLSGCAVLQDDLRPPSISLVSIEPESSSIADIRFRCRFRLDNPNDVALPHLGRIRFDESGRFSLSGGGGVILTSL